MKSKVAVKTKIAMEKLLPLVLVLIIAALGLYMLVKINEPLNFLVAAGAAKGLRAAKKTATGPAATGPAATGPAATGPAATGRAATGPAATGRAATGPAATGRAATGPAATGRCVETGGQLIKTQNGRVRCVKKKEGGIGGKLNGGKCYHGSRVDGQSKYSLPNSDTLLKWANQTPMVKKIVLRHAKKSPARYTDLKKQCGNFCSQHDTCQYAFLRKPVVKGGGGKKCKAIGCDVKNKTYQCELYSEVPKLDGKSKNTKKKKRNYSLVRDASCV